MTYIFIALAMYYWISWTGYLFALKSFDYFSASCNESWGWHVMATSSVTYCAYESITDKTFNDIVLSTVLMYLWGFAFIVHISPLIRDKIVKFHNKQKEKRA